MPETPENAMKTDRQIRNTGKESFADSLCPDDEIHSVLIAYRDNIFCDWAASLKITTREVVEEALMEFELRERHGESTSLREFFHRIGLRKENMELLFSVKAYMELQEQDKTFGNIAVRNGFVSREVVASTLAIQRDRFAKTRTSVKLSDILIANGDITEEQRNLVHLVQQRKDPSIYTVIRTVRKNAKEMEKKLDGLLDVMITGDKLTAQIILNYRAKETFTAANIKNWLFGKGVKYGVYDSMIETFLKEMTPGRRYPAAEGQPPVPGRDAAVVYHFDLPQEGGEAPGQKGSPAAAEEGMVAFVRKGDLLVERIPPEEGKPGITVFGQYCAPVTSRDQTIWSGKGVFSKDNLKFYAEHDGFPKLSGRTTLTVEPEFRHHGDLEAKSGNITLGVDVNVSGTIRSGVNIRCHNLLADAIEGAIIEATGDVTVKNGIHGAFIKAVGNVTAGKEIVDAEIRDHGNVTARSLKGVKLQAFGDVNVSKEIVESQMMISGACTVKSGGLISRGKILGSTISAREGIRTVDIGMAGTPPNKLRVGMDFNMEECIAVLKEKMAAADETRGTLEKRRKTIGEKLAGVEAKMAGLEKIRKSVASEFASCSRRIEDAEKKGDQERLAMLEELQHELETKSKASFEALDTYGAFRNGANGELSELDEKIRENDEKIVKIAGRIKSCSERLGGKPMVEVSGMVHESTVIKGVREGITLEKSLSNVKIEEIKIADSQWKMVAVART